MPCGDEQNGVAHCLPTIITAPKPTADGTSCLAGPRCRRQPPRSRNGARLHLEGPFLSPEAGLRRLPPAGGDGGPGPGLVAAVETKLARPILLLTLAPERPGAASLIRLGACQRQGVAIGHTAASAAASKRNRSRGQPEHASGQRAAQSVPKFDNPMIAQLAEDRLCASFIADGIHIPPAALKVLLRAKGLDRSILVTDATAAAAAPPGRYRLGRHGDRARPRRLGAGAWQRGSGRFGADASIRRCGIWWRGDWPRRRPRSGWRPTIPARQWHRP